MSIPAPSDCVTAHAELRHCAREACGPARQPHTLGRQRGAVLIIGLIMMALLSLLGLTALSTSLLEERMAANARDRTRAFQAAEAALRRCESSITSSTDFNNSKGFYTPASGSLPRWETVDWGSNTEVFCYPTNHDCDTGTETEDLPLLHKQPACIVERLSANVAESPLENESKRGGQPKETQRNYGYYRVTARGVGMNEHTVVMLQSHIRLSVD